MSQPPRASDRDPIVWCALLSVLFLAVSLVRLAVPSTPYFDEIHYLPAARALLSGAEVLNQEHPPLGKLIMAASIALFGDNAFGWRLPSAIAGAAALFAAMRALWFVSRDRFAAIAFGLLAATGFSLFVQSRIAMLDIHMAAFVAIACWQYAAAWAEPECGRRRLALCGIAIGCAIASKWNAVILAPLPGLVFLIARAKAGRRRLLFSRRGAPVPGITLVEATAWLGLVPLSIYALTYAPLYLLAPGDMAGGLIEQHRHMLALQSSVVEPHTYMSAWWEWVLNTRGIWYLYEFIDGEQRGIVMIGNPLTMLLGLPALAWCAWRGLRRHVAEGGVALLYAVSLGFWVIAAKPVQFYYHYLVPSLILCAALALAASALWHRGWKAAALLPIAGSVLLFVHFHPILSAAPLPGAGAFQRWMWLDSWI